MQELTRARIDLQAAGTAYMAYKRLTSQEKGRPRYVKVSWDLLDYYVNSLL